MKNLLSRFFDKLCFLCYSVFFGFKSKRKLIQLGYNDADPLLEIKLLSQLLKPNSTEAVLLDAGCGEGLAIQIARKYDFKQIIGIELDKTLATSAKERFRKVENISIYEISAVDYECPRIDLLYMFNPFQNEVMEKFLSSVFTLNTEVKLIYSNPQEINNFKSMGYKFEGKVINSWRTNWAIGTLKKSSN